MGPSVGAMGITTGGAGEGVVTGLDVGSGSGDMVGACGAGVAIGLTVGVDSGAFVGEGTGGLVVGAAVGIIDAIGAVGESVGDTGLAVGEIDIPLSCKYLNISSRSASTIPRLAKDSPCS